MCYSFVDIISQHVPWWIREGMMKQILVGMFSVEYSTGRNW